MSKIISKPVVYVLGAQEVRVSGFFRFLQDHKIDWKSDTEIPSQVLIEAAGRTCYMSFEKPRPGGNKAYLAHIKEVGHGSVLEHGIWNFLFTNVSRSLTHELVRHRAGMSYSQLSQRYVDEANTDFIVPSIIEEDKELYEEWLSCVAKCSDTYKSLTQKITEKLKKKGKTGTDLKKTARQAARSVLPNATETKIFVTGNVRSIRHFLEQRGNAAAEWEIRQLANIVLDVMMTEAPHLFGDYNLTPLEDGTFEIKTPYPKV